MAEPGAMEVVRESMRRSREEDLDRVLELVDPDAVLDATRRVLNPAMYRGHDGYRRFLAEVAEVWETVDVTAEDLEEVGDHVVGTGTVRAVGAQSGIELVQPAAQLWTVRNGKITRYVIGIESIEEARRIAREDL